MNASVSEQSTDTIVVPPPPGYSGENNNKQRSEHWRERNPSSDFNEPYQQANPDAESPSNSNNNDNFSTSSSNTTTSNNPNPSPAFNNNSGSNIAADNSHQSLSNPNLNQNSNDPSECWQLMFAFSNGKRKKMIPFSPTLTIGSLKQELLRRFYDNSSASENDYVVVDSSIDVELCDQDLVKHVLKNMATVRLDLV